MNYAELGLNRLGKKNEQTTPPEDVVVNSSSNPQDNVFSKFSQNGVDNGKSDAKNILTGTVITSCFIRTTDLPARVEMSGNDIRLYDDSKGSLNTITGDTASINFIRADQNPGDFIIQKRHGKNYNLDNVTEMFYTDNTTTRFNYFYLGRRGNDTEFHTNYIELIAEHDTNKEDIAQNGKIILKIARDGVTYLNGGIFVEDSATEIPGSSGVVVGITGQGPNGQVQMAYYDENGVAQSYIILSSTGIDIFPAISGAKAGQVNSDGTAAFLPSGWTSSTVGTGIYVVRRPADSTSHSAVATPMSTNRIARLSQMANNLFQISITDYAGAAADSQFSFIFS